MRVIRYLVLVVVALTGNVLGLRESLEMNFESATYAWALSSVALWGTLLEAAWPNFAKFLVVAFGVGAILCGVLGAWWPAFLLVGTANLFLYWYCSQAGFKAHIRL